MDQCFRQFLNVPISRDLKKRWRHNVMSSIIAANNKGYLQMPFLEKKGQYLNLRGVISVISKLTWYIYIGARLLEVGLSIKYTCARRVLVVILKSQLLLRLVSFAATIDGLYLNSRIMPNGLFSNRLKGQLLAKANMLLNHSTGDKESFVPNWSQGQFEYHGKDPLMCENCDIEMDLVFICYGPIEFRLHSKLGLNLYV